ncbi:hypothetical protein GCM10010401_18290 [Rarobacter faecitabidus]|uniref:Uncharacterized protein n=1 Tax=Rarobacter faecitabidus TaxID=13243 RepID=A0A542ZUR7_RARFA|nr:hypothetical protein [Rarobacter faecitabidus]TQL64039.1 hypothetical protein FB461_0524 [Rarobacter faecitabidus]
MTPDTGLFHSSDGDSERGKSHVSAAVEPVTAPIPWASWHPGQRVMVRVVIDDPRHKYTDVLGHIESLTESELVIRRRDESLATIPVTAILTGKPVPPAPPRRRPKAE